MTESTHFVSYPENVLRRNARHRLGGTSLLGIVLKQAFSEKFLLRVVKGVNFRHSENIQATRAYRAMSISEFEGINARQQWANWRTVPRNLNGRIPAKPLFAIDLCCGVGHSTEVLACYLPQGSSILGIEFNPDFVAQARARKEKYRHQDGALQEARFVAGSVLETFRDEKGAAVPAASIDVVNCCGAVGVHFKPEAARTLVEEVARVVKPGGIAMIDSGPHGTNPRELTGIFESLGFERINAVRSCFVDYSLQICFRKKPA